MSKNLEHAQMFRASATLRYPDLAPGRRRGRIRRRETERGDAI